jgi:chromosome partitioning protein
MPVVAVVNRKGGSGKSTLAAHLAAWLAHQGCAVMLGDVDRQQSTRAWLRRRNAALPAIAPWTVDQNMLRVPTGITHVVLDTPGGMHGFELARMVMFADAVLMPVCNSAFDREAAAACHAELMALPRVASGRCKLAAVGMRIDARTHASQVLSDWAAQLKLPFLSVLRETQLYVQCLERGMTIFDLSGQRTAADLTQWQPILDWLTPILMPDTATQPVAKAAAEPVVKRVGSSLPDSLMPAQESMIPGGRFTGAQVERRVAQQEPANGTFVAARPGVLQPRQQIPAFLRQAG